MKLATPASLVPVTLALALGCEDRVIVVPPKPESEVCTIRQRADNGSETVVRMKDSGEIESVSYIGEGEDLSARHDVADEMLVVHHLRDGVETVRVEHDFVGGKNVSARVFDVASGGEELIEEYQATFAGDTLVSSRRTMIGQLETYGADGAVRTYPGVHFIARSLTEGSAYIEEMLVDVDPSGTLPPSDDEPSFFVSTRRVTQRDAQLRPLETTDEFMPGVTRRVTFSWSGPADATRVHVEASEDGRLVTEDGAYDAGGLLTSLTYRSAQDGVCELTAQGTLAPGADGDATSTLEIDDGCTGTVSQTDVDEVTRAMFRTDEDSTLEETCPGVVPFVAHFGRDAVPAVRPIASFAPLALLE